LAFVQGLAGKPRPSGAMNRTAIEIDVRFAMAPPPVIAPDGSRTHPIVRRSRHAQPCVAAVSLSE
jgi:hypothetical protein